VPLRCRPYPAAHKAVNFYQLGLQDFSPDPGRYDIFWVQWCLMCAACRRHRMSMTVAVAILEHVICVLLLQTVIKAVMNSSSLVCAGI